LNIYFEFNLNVPFLLIVLPICRRFDFLHVHSTLWLKANSKILKPQPPRKEN
jgi:hypothetical protein